MTDAFRDHAIKDLIEHGRLVAFTVRYGDGKSFSLYGLAPADMMLSEIESEFQYSHDWGDAGYQCAGPDYADLDYTTNTTYVEKYAADLDCLPYYIGRFGEYVNGADITVGEFLQRRTG